VVRRKKKAIPAHKTQAPEGSSAPKSDVFSKATLDQIKQEIQHQEEQVRNLRLSFPRVSTGTTWELSDVEKQVSEKLAEHEELMQFLQLELVTRGETSHFDQTIPADSPASARITTDPAVAATTTSDSTPQTGEFIHSDDFRSIRWLGKEYSLTTGQAQVMQMLWEANCHGTSELSEAYILERLGSPASRLADTFRQREPQSELWGSLIVRGGTRGAVRLNLPPFTKSKP
jgi:hypothetical protein